MEKGSLWRVAPQDGECHNLNRVSGKINTTIVGRYPGWGRTIPRAVVFQWGGVARRGGGGVESKVQLTWDIYITPVYM